MDPNQMQGLLQSLMSSGGGPTQGGNAGMQGLFAGFAIPAIIKALKDAMQLANTQGNPPMGQGQLPPGMGRGMPPGPQGPPGMPPGTGPMMTA